MHATDQPRCPAGAGHLQRDRRGEPWRRLRAALAASVAAALLAPGLAAAVPVCSITTSNDVSFGVYDVFAVAPTVTTVVLTIKCPRGATVTIDKGNAPTYDPRLMRSGGTDVLAYNLYQDPGFSWIWGDGTGGTRAFVTPGGNSQATIYARIPPGQEVSPGDYSDSIVLTVYP